MRLFISSLFHNTMVLHPDFICEMFQYSFVKDNSENYFSRKFSLRLSENESKLERVMEIVLINLARQSEQTSVPLFANV